MDSDQPHQCARSAIHSLGDLDWPGNDRLGRWLEQRREVLRARWSATQSDTHCNRKPNTKPFGNSHRHGNSDPYSYSNTNSDRNNNTKRDAKVDPYTESSTDSSAPAISVTTL